MSRDCQWCDQPISYSPLADWYTVVTRTGLAIYFDKAKCLEEWAKSVG